MILSLNDCCNFHVFFIFVSVCQLVGMDVDVIFGPSSRETSGIVASIAEKFEIPHLIFHWKTKSMDWKRSAQKLMTLNMYPDSDFLAESIANFLVDSDWKSYTIIYENKENLIRLKDILQIHKPKVNSADIIIEQFDENFEMLLKKVKQSSRSNIILDISAQNIIPFLKNASNLNMLTEYTNYFITNLDTYTLNFNEIPEFRSNVTFLRIIDPTSEELTTALRAWRQRDFAFNLSEKQVLLEAGLVHDAVKLYSEAALKLYGGLNQKLERKKYSCDKPGRFKNEKGSKSNYGFQVLNFMRAMELDGITGEIRFNSFEPYQRSQFYLEIVELSNGEFRKIASWDSTNKLQNDRKVEDFQLQKSEVIKNKTFIVASRLEPPFLMQREVSFVFKINCSHYSFALKKLLKTNTTCNVISDATDELNP